MGLTHSHQKMGLESLNVYRSESQLSQTQTNGYVIAVEIKYNLPLTFVVSAFLEPWTLPPSHIIWTITQCQTAYHGVH